MCLRPEEQRVGYFPRAAFEVGGGRFITSPPGGAYLSAFQLSCRGSFLLFFSKRMILL